ncbi:hypothetical protein ACIRLA_28745 [Streptomyces sp. NPDC102364]|uniref:hypothetical protein n=1 Tax=Streptomyces sp. NPDC102364 TaxID=3366161 RepID=UPI003822D632
MEATHMAIGAEARGVVRLDVSWTPGVEGVEVAVRNAKTLREYVCYRAPRLAIMPFTPDRDTLNSAMRSILGAVQNRSIRVAYAYAVAHRSGFVWVPEKLAEAAPDSGGKA